MLKWLLFTHGGAAKVANKLDHLGLTPIDVACIPALHDEAEVRRPCPHHLLHWV